MNIGIVGSREFEDERAVTLIRRVVDRLIEKHGPFTLVSGGCTRGADTISEHYIRSLGTMPNPIIFLANSEKAYAAFGKSFRDRAFGRNGWIVDHSDFVVAFFAGAYNTNRENDGMTGGTLNSVNHAKRQGKLVYAYFAKNDQWVTIPATEVTGL